MPGVPTGIPSSARPEGGGALAQAAVTIQQPVLSLMVEGQSTRETMMKVFVAGATGAIGRQLVPLLVEAGHEVHGMTHSAAKQQLVRDLGAEPVVADALDADQVAEAVARVQPDVIVHQLTSIGPMDLRHFDRAFAMTNRLRTEGTDHLLSAGQAVGVKRFVAQSFFAAYERVGGPVKTEEDSFGSDAAKEMRETVAAIRHVEDACSRRRGPRESCCGTAASTGPARRSGRTASRPRRSGSASSRWWATAAACGRSSTSPTRPRRPWRRSSTAAEGSTTSSTTSPRRSPSGCPSWRVRWVPRSRCTCPGSWGGC